MIPNLKTMEVLPLSEIRLRGNRGVNTLIFKVLYLTSLVLVDTLTFNNVVSFAIFLLKLIDECVFDACRVLSTQNSNDLISEEVRSLFLASNKKATTCQVINFVWKGLVI